MKRAKIAAIMGAMVLVLGGAALAESLWSDSGGSLFMDRRAASVGDIVTIVISETASARETATTETNREAQSSGQVGFEPLNDLLEKIGFQSSDSYEGSGSTTHQGTLTATITAMVERVLPNGNLAIKGRKVLTINNEEQEIIISGIIRPEDVGISNTIRSSMVADAQIEYSGKGYVASKQKPGIISKIFGWLF